MKLTDLILYPSRGDRARALAFLDTPNAVDRQFVDRLWEWCRVAGVDYAIAYAWFCVETGNATSIRWTRDHNPGGIGIPADSTVQPFVIPDGDAAAQIHTQCYYAAVMGKLHPDIPLWPEGMNWAKKVWLPKVNDPGYPSVTQLTHLDMRYKDSYGRPQATWAWGFQEGQPSQSCIDRSRAIWPDLPRQEEDVAMAIVATECPIHIDPVTKPMANRPALAMPDASFVTVHETGNRNPAADALMHRNFVHNGGGEHAVSFHFVIDQDDAYQLIYLNENAWHASDGFTGRGNRDTIAIETCQNGDKHRTRNNLAYLIAELYRNPGRFAWRGDVGRQDDLPAELMKERTKRHYDWAPDKKWCPEFILNEGVWPDLLNAVAAELKDLAPQLPKYAPSILPDWWNEKALIDLPNVRDEEGILYKPMGTRVTAIRETGAYAHAWKPEGKGKRVRANIKQGETVDLRYRVLHPTTKEPWGLTRHGTWISLKYFTPTITLRNRTEDE